jgi:DNA-binding MurR/RpiR family transcriptional regulator
VRYGRRSRSSGSQTGSKARGAGGITGRFRLINKFIDKHARNCSTTAALAWVVIWRDSRDGIAVTSYSRLADRIGVSRSTVARAIRQLRELGYLEVARTGSESLGPTWHRAVIVEVPDGSEAATAQKTGTQRCTAGETAGSVTSEAQV